VAQAQSALDGFDPGANNPVNALAVQADGKILVGGDFTTLGGGGTGTTTRYYIGRLNADGSLDTSFNPGANSLVNAISVQADGKILVGGYFTTLGGGGTGTTTRNYIGRLNADGSLDTSFNPGANWGVYALSVQADGKILVGGWFSTLGGGGTGTTTRNRIGRLNADGSLDTSFNPGANGTVHALAVQADGKILVGGAFTTLGGGGTGTTTRNYIGRLNADGSLDTSFNPGANWSVYALSVQADGKIVVGGNFTTLGGGGTGTTTRNGIGRLNADGSLDTSFNPGANNPVFALAVQADGKILVGGLFTTLGGGGMGTTTRNQIGRLNADGSLDTSFNPGANSDVWALAVQADGKILVGGGFTTLGGGGTGTTTRNYIGRLNADGSLDTSFNPGANGAVYALAVQADGKILVGGAFTTLGGGGIGTTTRNRIGRLNADGSLDTSFNPGASSTVYALAVQADGKILVGGGFTTLGGGGTGTTTRNQIGRLTNTDPALQNLTVDTNGATITWERSGASPEVDRVTCELSTDGATYTALGTAARISGGWQLTGLSLPKAQNIFIRARGFYASGYLNGSGSIVESVRTVLAVNPLDFDGDGKPDILWRNSATGEIVVLLMDGTRRLSGISLGSVHDANWRIVGIADFNGDNNPDLLWRNIATGQNAVWFFDGTTYVGTATLDAVSDLNWRIVAVADFNTDNKRDILWFNSSTGEIVVWFMNGTTRTSISSLGTVTDLNWKVVAAADFNSDGKADILWRNCSTGHMAIWFLDGTTLVRGADLQTVSDLNWKIVQVADFNADGKADILWRNSSTGQNAIWFMDGTTWISGANLDSVSDLNWLIGDLTGEIVPRIGTLGPDFDGDGNPDILWSNSSTGEIVVWLMNGTQRLRGISLGFVSDTTWKIVAIADFNADGKPDILWRNSANGHNAVWFMDGTTLIRGADLETVSDLSWNIVADADFNSDGKPDILWFNSSTGEIVVWFMNGISRTSGYHLGAVTDLNWKIVAATDFNSDGKPNILWRNSSTGQNAVWFMDGATLMRGADLQTVSDLNWKIVQVADFNADGKPDILWRNSSTGQNAVWFMDGITLTRGVELDTVADTNWLIR
jgi:uncharacterized delta-60 repeat protein